MIDLREIPASSKGEKLDFKVIISVMIRSAEHGRIEALAEYLSNGIPIDYDTGDGMQFLHYAAAAGSAKSVSFLIECGANLNAKTKYGNTPLHMAAHEGHLACVVQLLELGVDLKIEDHRGSTAYDDAISNGHVTIADKIKDYEVARLQAELLDQAIQKGDSAQVLSF